MSEIFYIDSVKSAITRINTISNEADITAIQAELSQLNRHDDEEEFAACGAWLNTNDTYINFYNSNDALDKAIDNAFDRLVNTSNDEFDESDFELLNLNKRSTQFLAMKRLEQWLDDGAQQSIANQEPHSARRLNRRRKKLQAALALHLKLVGGEFGSKRAINFMKWQRKEEQEAQARWLKTTQVTNSSTGQSFSLEDVAFTNKKRISEMMCRLDGIEKYSESNGMRWARVVCTLPPKFHPNPTTKKSKSSWDGSLPDESARTLQDKWEKLRAYLAKHNVKLSGVWTREAHADACPHINYMVYFPTGQEDLVEDAFKKYFGRSKKACNFMFGETGLDSARFASYCTKYFRKHFIEETEEEFAANLTLTEEQRAESELDREEALGEETAASNFGYRRYGFIGTPAISIWRRLRASDTAPTDLATEELWQCAKSNDYARYIELSGGLSVKNSKRNFEAVKAEPPSNSTCSKHMKKLAVVVGVRNKSNCYEFVTKKLGIWELSKLVKEIVIEDQETDSTTSNQNVKMVTLKQSYPSKAIYAVEIDYHKFKSGEYGQQNDPPTLH